MLENIRRYFDKRKIISEVSRTIDFEYKEINYAFFNSCDEEFREKKNSIGERYQKSFEGIKGRISEKGFLNKNYLENLSKDILKVQPFNSRKGFEIWKTNKLNELKNNL